MLAGQIFAPRQIRLVDVPEPAAPPVRADTGAGEILFQPELGSLCGSDLLYFEADYPEFQPGPGHSLHEVIGTILEATGERFRVGDRVLCVPQDQAGLCERFWVSEERAIPLDPRPPEEHAVLAQPLGTVLYALRKLPSVLDLDVAVVGQGPIGQLFCAALRNLGARRIFAIDRLGSRLQTSPKMGATDVIEVGAEDPVEAIHRATDGAMPHLVVEAIGHREQQLNLCIELCRPEGRILAFGALPERVDGVRWGRLYRKNLTVQASVDPDFGRDFPLAMRWIAEGRIDVSPLLTHRFGLPDVQLAFDTFFERRDGALKVLIDFVGRPRSGSSSSDLELPS